MFEEGGPGTTCDEEQGGSSMLHTERNKENTNRKLWHGLEYVNIGRNSHGSNIINLQQIPIGCSKLVGVATTNSC